MQLLLFQDFMDLSDKNVMIGLSGGINSAALLCYMAKYYPYDLRPKNLFLYYAHLEEHSPDTFDFVQANIEYAKKHFDGEIIIEITHGSVIECFRQQKMIAHPIRSTCTRLLKIEPMEAWARENNIDIDQIGYIASEKGRKFRLLKQKKPLQRLFPIIHLRESECFDLVKTEIGWYPAIYDIYENGKRVFLHNNCLPCKNWQGILTSESASGQYAQALQYFPEYIEKAQHLCKELNRYWGSQSKSTRM